MENILRIFLRFVPVFLITLICITLQGKIYDCTQIPNDNVKVYNKNLNYTRTHKDGEKQTHLRFIDKSLNSTQNIEHAELRAGKGFLNIFDVIVFDNIQCNLNSSIKMNGTCYNKSECKSLGGTPMGTCADGIGVCCAFKYNCGTISTEDVSYFQNFEYPLPVFGPIACTFTVDIRKNIQQVLLEFLTFELERPTDGDCIEDEFIVTGQNRNSIVPSLCGINTGQHMFIEVDQSPTKILHMSIFGKTNNQRLFNIKVTQLGKRIAPRGCLQYFTTPKGIIKSFNYDEVGNIITSRGGSYFNNLNYAICIEREQNMCSISYTNEINDEELEFGIVNMEQYYKTQATITFTCPDDFLAVNGLRLCGEKLYDRADHRELNDYTSNTGLITDYGNGPIVLPFQSDNMYVGRGFQIIYEQNYCDSKFLTISHNLG